MRYYKNLYIGNNIDNSALEKLKNSEPTSNVYAICLCSDTKGLFEIMSTYELLNPYSAKRNYAVIALLEGKGSAKRAIVDLLCSWLKAHKDLSGIREYYNNNSL